MTDAEKKWDLIIKPKTGWFEVNFREIWKYRDLVLMFVRRDFAANYTQTVLGPIWHILQPILTVLVFLLVFRNIGKLSTDDIDPTLFYMSGIILWNYFSASLLTVSNTFVVNAPIFGKVYFPRIMVPISVVISNMIRFAIQFSLLLATIIIWYFRGIDVHLTFANWIWIPVLVVTIAGLTLGLGIIISSLTAKYRDLIVLLTFALQLFMYATPIAYPMSFLKSTNMKWTWLIELNPLSPIVEAFRYCMFGKGTFTPYDLLYSGGFILILILVGFLLFNRVEKKFMDTV
jgi:lipopolysaccharide transport system permease protein